MADPKHTRLTLPDCGIRCGKCDYIWSSMWNEFTCPHCNYKAGVKGAPRSHQPRGRD